jgi:hypothetical protein
MNFEDYYLEPVGYEKGSCQRINLPAVEEKYNAQFVGDFCIKSKHGWSEQPVAIFWQETPPVEGYSNYFGVFVQDDTVYITSGASAFAEPIEGIVARNGEVIFSRYRHDYHSSTDGSVTVDGGRDYLRVLGDIHQPRVHIIPDGPRLKIIPRCLPQGDQ